MNKVTVDPQDLVDRLRSGAANGPEGASLDLWPVQVNGKAKRDNDMADVKQQLPMCFGEEKSVVSISGKV